MNPRFCWLLIASLPLSVLQCRILHHKELHIKSVPPANIELQDRFWRPRLETNLTMTIPHCFRKIEESGGIDNFASAAGLVHLPHQGRVSSDAEFFKVMEASYCAQVFHPDEKSGHYLDSLSIIIAEAQEEDGYLYTARTVDPEHPSAAAGAARWSNLRKSHELYNAGHLYEAAVAAAIEGRNELLLDVAQKNFDLIDRTFGLQKNTSVPGHQEIELALIRMYRLTGKPGYLALARFFLDGRGRDAKTTAAGSPAFFHYNQNHLPVTEQFEAVGHVVRATYMYAAMADIAALMCDSGYKNAVEKIWQDIVGKKMYITGGVGNGSRGEAFGEAYQLPNMSAYNETCAAIGFALFTQRMFQLEGDARYIDVLERILYNGFLAGVGLQGDQFFYLNPLESDGVSPFNKGKATRQEWFNCPCCPTNVARTMPSIANLLYATGDNEVYVNLFAQSSATVDLAENAIEIIQETLYPWEGRIKLFVNPEVAARFTIKIRIPGWARNQPVPGGLYFNATPAAESLSVVINNRRVEPSIKKGFAVLKKRWQKGDYIEVFFAMPVRRVQALASVTADSGRVAIERGPLVYCAEEIDNRNMAELRIADNAQFITEFQPGLLDGVMLLKTDGSRPERGDEDIILVPYYGWSHRGTGKMAVWLPKK